MEMQHTYEEQQSHMDNMIRQVALLAEMIKEVKENRAKSVVNENTEVEEGVRKAEEKETAEAEKKSEALLEEKATEKKEADEEKMQTKEKSMILPPDDGTPKEILEGACDESHLTKEAIECGEKIDNTTLYLQPNIVQTLKRKVEESTSVVEEESIQAKEPRPMIDESEGCSYEEKGPEWREERSRRKDAREIYWVQLQPWPEPRNMAKPPHSGVRPKENTKVLGTDIIGKSRMPCK